LGFRGKPVGEEWSKRIVSCWEKIRLRKRRKTEQAVDILHEKVEGREEEKGKEDRGRGKDEE
jgi:hypothetical protein